MATATASPAVGLCEAAEDPRLFALALSPRQKELLRLVEAHPLAVVAAGRQSGKSLLAAAMLVHNLLLRPDLDETAGSLPRYALAIANSQGQAGLVLSYARSFVERSPLLRGQLVNAQEKRLEFRGGRILASLPCTDRLQRGLSASAVCLDEFSHFISASLGPRTAERVWQAVRPTVAIYGEQARTLLISTPGESDLFGRMHAQAAAGELPGGVAFTASTREMNPRVSEAFIESERAVLGADFAREYLAEFSGGSTAFLDPDDVAQVRGRYSELSPDDGTDWTLGFDPAFAGDPAAAVVVGRSRQDRRRLLVAKVERWQPKRSRTERRAAKTAEQVSEVRDYVLDGVADLAARYRGATIVTDQHLSATVVQGLRDRGHDRVRVEAWTGRTLTEAFQAIRARVIAQTIELPRDDMLAAELARVRSRSRGGASPTVEVPRTAASHLDSALALAAAVRFLERKTPGRPARGLSSFGPGYISEQAIEQAVAGAQWRVR
jgi:phage terminase large subunit-like protein